MYVKNNKGLIAIITGTGRIQRGSGMGKGGKYKTMGL